MSEISILNKLTSKFKIKDNGTYTSGNPYKHGGRLWCNGVRYFPRDVVALLMSEEYYKKRIKDLEVQLNVIETQLKYSNHMEKRETYND